MNVESASARKQTSLYIKELTQVRNPMFVMSVVSPSVIRETSLSIKKLIREKIWKWNK
jgi:hypothetical protein